MKNISRVEKISGFTIWILIPILGFYIFLFSQIRVLDFSSPYLNDWIFINIMIFLFWTFFTIAILLTISVYYQIKSTVFENLMSKNEIEKSINYSQRTFVYAFEFFNLMVICTVILTLFWIICYFTIPFIDPFIEQKEKSAIISAIITVFITWVIMKNIGKTRVGSFFKNLYSDCIFLTKKFKDKWLLYLAALSLIFPSSCYRFELQINKETFIKGQDLTLIVDITLGGMTSSSNYYNKVITYLIGDNLEKEILLDFMRVDKMKFKSIKDISDLSKGNYKIISFYKRQLIFFKWNISREKIFQII